MPRNLVGESVIHVTRWRKSMAYYTCFCTQRISIVFLNTYLRFFQRLHCGCIASRFM